MKHMIEVKHVTKRFGSACVLNDVSVDFEEGKIHGLVGRNGSGKTMLLKCILGFVTPTAGEVLVDGRPAQLGRVGEIGGIVETPGFLPGMSGARNLEYLASLHGAVDRGQIRKAMERVGLDPDNRKTTRKYSMGMRQRLGIAQCIMDEPRILILDEPMNGLDNAGVEDMLRFFQSLREEGRTLLIASHNPLDIQTLCDTVCEMDRGTLTMKPVMGRPY